jgi:hypothetical protein
MNTTRPAPKNDGRWHGVQPVEAREAGLRWTGHLPGDLNTVHVSRRGWRGRWARFNADARGGRGGWEYETCVDLHRKRSAAITCGEKLARRWNAKECLK